MKHVQLELSREFAVVAGNARAQAAEMVLAPDGNVIAFGHAIKG